MRTTFSLAAALALAGAADAQDSCIECHPGALRGLQTSSHKKLATDPNGCVACHGQLERHVATASQSLAGTGKAEKPAPVAAQSCVACHGTKYSDPALAVHAFTRELLRARQAEEQAQTRPASRPATATAQGEPRDDEPRGLTAPQRALGADWSLLAQLGYRFVTQSGSRDRYDTDVRLREGFRLSELELLGEKREDSAPFDRLLVRGTDIADPWQHVRGELERKDVANGTVDWRKSEYSYRASGDYHRVDTKSDDLAFGLEVPIVKNLEVFADYERTLSDGFWLTERVGNRNLSPVGAVSGVASPRELDYSTATAGVRGTLAGFAFTASAEYYDEDARDRWSYAQASALNPAFPESETFLAHTSLHGPGAMLSISRDLERFHFGWKTRWLSRDKVVSGSGVQTGYDIGAFVTTTTSYAAGNAETWLSDLTAGYELTDELTLDIDLRWRDHREKLTIDQVDETLYPGLGTAVTVPTQSSPSTAQRVFDGGATLSWQVAKPVSLYGGYGFSRETLRVPDLEAGDSDFVKGTIRTDGAMFGGKWRPTKEWTFSVDGRTFSMGGAQLHELTQDEQRSLGAKLAWAQDGYRAQTFWKVTQAENDVSSYLNDVTTFGVSGGTTLGETFDLDLAWVYSDMNSRVLTNFYFDPDPTPVPTFVGFKGDTHVVSGNLVWRPCKRFEGRALGAYTTTNGSFDVDTWDWRVDASYEVLDGGRAGVTFRRIEYDEAGGLDDYAATLVMVYWRQVLGRAR